MSLPKVLLATLLLALAPVMTAAQAADPPTVTVAAAGDIACDPTDPFFNGGNGTATNCRMRATSDLILKGGFDAVLLLGDNQYWDGTLAAHLVSFAPTWGRLGPLLRPAPGNHEYQTPGAAGYYDYFGAAAGDRTKGWYSYDLGSWHIVVLNSNCSNLGANSGCGPGSPQLQWLTADLAAHPRACTLAYWHHPRFSSGAHGNDATYDTFWRELYKAGADVVLVGHDHDYERFAPQDPDAKADASYGIRQFVVGTGGRETRAFSTIRANSESRNHNDLGVLKLVLRPDGYDWEFLPVPGGTFNDQGSASCHNAPDTASLFLHKGRFKAECGLERRQRQAASGQGRRPRDRQLGRLLVRQPGQLGAAGEGGQCLLPQRQVLGPVQQHQQPGVHAHGHRHPDGRGQTLRQPSGTAVATGGSQGFSLSLRKKL